ncbi:MAG: hypothetical protein ACI9FB_001784 [Candidatus Azotimanducaceae bacterium]|jgi:hypothetical protein
MTVANETKNKSADEYTADLTVYANKGKARAIALGNRGPARFKANGQLTDEILDVYWETGFYVFEGLIDQAEIKLLQSAMADLLDRAPIDNGATIDHKGRPAFGQEFARPVYSLIKPLTDPWGGTAKLNGRHETKMSQPTPAAGAPQKVVFLMGGMCQIMDAGLRLYGHPDLLSIAASINGNNFVPYNDAIFIKEPGLGGSVSWHQDGVTHWDAPNWDQGIHGFNFQVQLHATSPRSCLWVMPGTHRLGKLDVKKLVAENNGSEQLPDAVPLFCEPGDVTIVNRQALHCSFANTSPDQRISLTFGFHRYSSVLGAKGALSQTEMEIYDEHRINDRSKVISVAIDARSQFYPIEPRYDYQLMRGSEAELRFDDDTWEKVIRDYNLKDLSI